MHFHVALYLIIDHTGAALNRVCLPDRYKQLNNSSAAVLDRMWCESGRRISCTLNQPLAVFFLQDKKRDSKRLNGRFLSFFPKLVRGIKQTRAGSSKVLQGADSGMRFPF